MRAVARVNEASRQKETSLFNISLPACSVHQNGESLLSVRACTEYLLVPSNNSTAREQDLVSPGWSIKVFLPFLPAGAGLFRTQTGKQFFFDTQGR